VFFAALSHRIRGRESYRGALWKGELVNEEIGKTQDGTMGKVLRISANAAHVKGAIGKVVEALGFRSRSRLALSCLPR
jgi:hypothetical protein